jgi:hypothetical protein
MPPSSTQATLTSLALLAALFALPGTLRAEDWLTTAPTTKPAKNAKVDTTPATLPDGTQAPITQDAATLINSMKQKDAFFRIWPNYGRYYIQWGEGYAAMPAFEPRFPSNKGITVEKAQEILGQAVDEQIGNIIKHKIILASPAEAQAAVMTLQAMEPGQYGYIHSFVVEKVLSPNEMVVSNIWIINSDVTIKERDSVLAEAERRARAIGEGNEDLKRINDAKNQAILSTVIVDANGATVTPKIDEKYTAKVNALPNTETLLTQARAEVNGRFLERDKIIKRQKTINFAGPYKVKGFLTAGIIEGRRWFGSNALGKVGEGFQVAVIPAAQQMAPEIITSSDTKGANPIESNKMLIEIIPAYYFKTGLTLDQFVLMCAKYGMTPDQFVDMAVAEMRKEPTQARDRIFVKLEKARKAWERSKLEKLAQAKADQQAADAAEKKTLNQSAVKTAAEQQKKHAANAPKIPPPKPPRPDDAGTKNGPDTTNDAPQAAQ